MHATQKKILFIEDEPDQITIVRMRLETSGFEFVSADNGKEGLKKAVSEKPDLILLDIIMPGMSGLEVCAKLRKNPKTASIPVIATTAAGIDDLERQCFAAGVDDCVRKPYEAEDLLKKIRHLIEK